MVCYTANNITCRPDYHINIVYCGGCCVSHYREYNHTLKLFDSQELKIYLIVCSSHWTGYHDRITYRESKCYCMISNGSSINGPKPYHINKESGDECAIVKLTSAIDNTNILSILFLELLISCVSMRIT